MNERVHEDSFRPFLRYIFWPIALVVMVVVIGIDIAVYFAVSGSIKKSVQDELQNIATNVAANIPVEMHELLIDPEQQNSDSGYKYIEQYFQSVMDGNPKINDIYTLRPTNQAHRFSFVVSAMVTSDIDGNGRIDENETKPALGEMYDATQSPQMEQGLFGPVADEEITNDKWGSWISGYAPLRDDHGRGVAVVGVDYSAQAMINEYWQILRALLIITVALIPILLIIVYIISLYFIRPFRNLARGMDHVSHGDFSYRLPHGKGEAAVFNERFNSMLTMFEHSLEHKKKEESDKNETVLGG